MSGWCAYPVFENAEFRMWLNSLVHRHKQEIAEQFEAARGRLL